MSTKAYINNWPYMERGHNNKGNDHICFSYTNSCVAAISTRNISPISAHVEPMQKYYKQLYRLTEISIKSNDYILEVHGKLVQKHHKQHSWTPLQSELKGWKGKVKN